MRRPWTEIAAAKCAERSARINDHSQRQVDSDAEARIAEIVDVGQLTDLLQAGNVSAEDIAVAYIKR
jgi:hypothetical protein